MTESDAANLYCYCGSQFTPSLTERWVGMLEDAPSGPCPEDGQLCAFVPDPNLLFLELNEEGPYDSVYEHFLAHIPVPPPCICGNRKYTITFYHTYVKAECTRRAPELGSTCRYSRYYYYGAESWSGAWHGVRSRRG